MTARAQAHPFSEIEARWQQEWSRRRLFEADPDPGRPAYAIFELPPFPNGSLHLGHVRVYTTADVTARYRRLAGYNVLYSTGYDAYGLPIEIAAAERGAHPRAYTDACVATMGAQFRRLGYSHDPRRIVAYHEPRFYRWTQWLFLRLLAADLVYRGHRSVNWCTRCRTTLADSQVEAGRCWRCHDPTTQRTLRQWFARESAFAAPLLAGLDALTHWPAQVRDVQARWIGREPAVVLRLGGPNVRSVDAHCARPGLVGDIRFVAVGLGHPWLETLTGVSPSVRAALTRLRSTSALAAPRRDYGRAARKRATFDHDVSVVRLGVHVVHPLTGAELPVVATNALELNVKDEALAAAPAHDPLAARIAASLELPEPRPASDYTAEDERRILAELQRRGAGYPTFVYRLRDWNISRQRYWGPPVPVIDCDRCGTVPVPEHALPVLLPDDVDLDAAGNPLEVHHSFPHAPCPRCFAPARRETDTLDTFFNGIWPFLSYVAALHADVNPFLDTEAHSWMPIDVAIGGFEHATTVYFHDRFLMRALERMGLPSHAEPFERLVCIGMVQLDGRKMSKHLGNTVAPDALLDAYGADAVRLGILQAARLESSFDWSESLVVRAHGFLAALWRFFQECKPVLVGRLALAAVPAGGGPLAKLVRQHDSAVRQITTAYERFRYKAAIEEVQRLFAALQESAAAVMARARGPRDDELHVLGRVGASVLACLQPVAPHITQQLWSDCGGTGLLAEARLPVAMGVQETGR